MKAYWKKDRKRWAVDIPADLSDTGKRKREFFNTKAEGDAFASDRSRKKAFLDEDLPLFSASDAVRIAKALDLVGGLEALEEAAREWKQKRPVGTSVTVKQAFDQYYHAKTVEGRGKEYLGTIRVYLGKILDSFGARQMSSITGTELTRWFDLLQGHDHKGKTYPLSPTTKKNIHVVVNSLFEWCCRRDFIARNPMRGVPRPKPTRPKREIFTVDEMERALKIIEGPDLVYIALGAFAGLRASEIEGNQDHEGIQWEDLDFKRKEINVSEERTKKRGRIVKMEAAFIRIMKRTNIKSKGPIVKLFDHELAAMRERIVKAGNMDKWPENGLRHSFGSYHLGAFENAPLTSLQIGHTNPSMTLNHYARAVSKSDALRYWALG